MANIIDDSGLSSLTLYESVKEDIKGYMKNAAHAKRLSGLKAGKDLSYCFNMNEFDVLPILKDGLLVRHEA